MYIWTVKVEVRWDYHLSDSEADDVCDYTVAARNYEHAMKKVESLALAKSRKYFDPDDGVDHYPVKIVDVISIERGDYIDA